MKKGIIIISFMILILLFDKVNASVIESSDRIIQDTTYLYNCGALKYNGQTAFNSNSGGLMCEYHYSSQGGSFFSYIEFNKTLNQNYDYYVIPITINLASTSSVDTRVLVQNLQFTVNVNNNEGGRPVYYELVHQINADNENNQQSTNLSMTFNLYVDSKQNTKLNRVYYSLENTILHPYNATIYISGATYYIKGGTSQIIDNQNQNTDKIINETTTYDTNATEPTNGTTINEYTQKEEQLFTIMDFNATSQTVTINPNTSNFIWLIVERLRTISPYIILFMTSVLALGLIKMVLNR